MLTYNKESTISVDIEGSQLQVYVTILKYASDPLRHALGKETKDTCHKTHMNYLLITHLRNLVNIKNQV